MLAPALDSHCDAVRWRMGDDSNCRLWRIEERSMMTRTTGPKSAGGGVNIEGKRESDVRRERENADRELE